MTKADLQQMTGISATDIDTIFNTIKNEVKNGNKVAIHGFGTFEMTQRAARTSRNPKTGESIQVPSKNAPRFKPSKTFKDLLN